MTACRQHQLVVISESVSGATVGATFATVAAPVIVAETYILDDMGMVGTASSEYGTTGADQTQVAVTTVGSTHPLGAGLAVGNTTTSTAAVTHGWAKPAAAAVIAATLPTDATKATVFGYDTGAVMSSGSAPARRVGWFHYAGTASNLTATAAALFDAAVTWAAQTTPVIRYTRDVTDRIVQRNVNNRTVARYSYTAGGDSSDLTLDNSNNLTEATLTLAGGVLYTWRATNPVWSYPNLHGDLALTTDNTGTKQGPTRIWDPWGRPLTTTSEQDNSIGELDYGWHGNAQRPLEHQTGAIPTIEMGARQYDPTLARFLETDPIEGGCANDYVYPDDPLNASDLSGTTASCTKYRNKLGKLVVNIKRTNKTRIYKGNRETRYYIDIQPRSAYRRNYGTGRLTVYRNKNQRWKRIGGSDNANHSYGTAGPSAVHSAVWLRPGQTIKVEGTVEWSPEIVESGGIWPFDYEIHTVRTDTRDVCRA